MAWKQQLHLGDATSTKPQGACLVPGSPWVLTVQLLWVIGPLCQAPTGTPGAQCSHWIKPLRADGPHPPVGGTDAQKEGFPRQACNSSARTLPARALWAAPTSGRGWVGSCLGPPSPLAAVCGDSPLVPRNAVIFGPDVIKVVPRFPANQQLRNTAPSSPPAPPPHRESM